MLITVFQTLSQISLKNFYIQQLLWRFFRNKVFPYQEFMHNLKLTYEISLNYYFLFNFRFDINAFHKDCDNKGIIVIKAFIFSKALR